MSIKKILLLLVLFSFYSGNFTHAQKRGKATYYAHKFHGRRTASGSLYNADKMTCAHRTYPFGTILKVRNLKNDKEVIVEVTDRGPFIKGRIIDLSWAAAKKLDAIGHGVFNVEITELGKDYQPIIPDSIIAIDTTLVFTRTVATIPADTAFLKTDSIPMSKNLKKTLKDELTRKMKNNLEGNRHKHGG